MRFAAGLAAVALAAAARGEAEIPAGPTAEEIAPGHGRAILAGNRLLRARVVERSPAEIVLEREDGLRILARSSDLVRELAPAEILAANVEPSHLFPREGTVVVARIVLRGPSGVLVEFAGGERRLLPEVRLIQGPQPPLELAAGPVLPRAAPEGVPGTVSLRSGRELAGRILGRNEDAVLLDPDGGGARLAVLAEAVARVSPRPGTRLFPATHRQTWWADVAGLRSMALPTALPLRAGDITLDQRLWVTTLHASPIPHLQLSVGGLWPAWPVEDAGWNALATVQGQLDLGPLVHLAAGVQGVASARAGAAFAYGAATFGTEELQATLYAGPPLPGAYRGGRFDDRIAAASATWRFLPSFAVTTEHWVRGSRWAGGVAFRLVRRRLALDAGVARLPERSLFPWVGLSVGLSAQREVTP